MKKNHSENEPTELQPTLKRRRDTEIIGTKNTIRELIAGTQAPFLT